MNDDKNQTPDDALEPADNGLYDGDAPSKLAEDNDTPFSPAVPGVSDSPLSDDELDSTEVYNEGEDEAAGLNLGHVTTHEEDLAEAQDVTEEY